ncbi:MAG: fructose-bisphosphatase class II family protein [Atopobium sp.]|uniref:fructose-bisphosphatase class II family protein n=1 Tax=Atopobium sp. TaxID=1872650 RepID=UPI002A813C7D|nr:fructose-bisphosphatase class II family protein [Atopobium sp.]MDY4522436.1 fructose-bisphosphatase class II family protein [Atopobium sp.]
MRQSLISNFQRVCEATAIEASKWAGRADKVSANNAAMKAVRRGLGDMSMSGHVVIGQRPLTEPTQDQKAKKNDDLLVAGETLGRGGDSLDIVVDPIEGTNLVANNQRNAISAIVFAPRATLLNAPVKRMAKIACGPAVHPEAVGIDKTPEENITAVARSLHKPVADVMVCILDRPRHTELIERVRATGARVKLVYDGDVQAALATAIPNTGADLMLGEGGGPEGVLACAGLKALGGFFQARFHFTEEGEREAVAAACDFDIDQAITMDEMVRTNDIHFVATGITNGSMLAGVTHNPDGSIQTHSIVVSSIDNTTSYVTRLYRDGSFGSSISEPGLHDSIF